MEITREYKIIKQAVEEKKMSMQLQDLETDAYHEESDSRFIRLPPEMKYKIFARLDLQEFACSRCVCKEWNRLLSRAALKKLRQSLNSSISRSPAFLIAIFFFHDCNVRFDENQPEFYFSLHEDTRLRFVDMLNRVRGYDLWVMSCNGVVVASPELRWFHKNGHAEFIVCNPSLRWFDRVPWTGVAKTQDGFQGVWHDPCTSEYTLVTCFILPDDDMTFTCYDIHIYESRSSEWRNFILRYKTLYQSLGHAKAIFFAGSFFWMQTELMRLDMTEGVVCSIPLPRCPLHADSCRDCQLSWALKGCEDNLVLVHYNSETCEIMTWRLLKNNTGQLHYYGMTHAGLSQQLFSKNPCEKGWGEVNVNQNGWWLWGASQRRGESYYDGQKTITLLDEQGKVRHIIDISYFTSFLYDSGKFQDLNGDLIVNRVFVFETDNFWEILAKS